jgi:hypothetical protein
VRSTLGAVEQRIEGDAARVDLEAAAGGELQETAIAAVAPRLREGRLALIAAAQGGMEGGEARMASRSALSRSAAASLRQTM